MNQISRLLVATALLVITGGMSAAFPATQTFKVKTPGGLKENLATALNDATGDVLIGYESDGEILVTLAKLGGSGRYKAKKAKRISGGDGISHRPSLAFDPSVNEFVATWDTGPEDLEAASDGSDPGASDILSRRIKRTNGKKTQGIVITVADGKLNIGPNLAVRAGGVEVFYTRHERPGVPTRRNLAAALIRRPIKRGAPTAPPQQLMQLLEGLSQIVGLAVHDAEACAVFTRFLLNNPFADYLFMNIVDGLAEYLESSGNGSPALGAFMYYLTELDYKVESWYEYGTPLRQRVNYMQFVDRAGDMSSPRALGGYNASNFVGRVAIGQRSSAGGQRSIAGDRGWVADVTAAGQIRALEIGGAAQVFQTVNLLKRTKDITNMSLVMLPEGRAMLVWIEQKNKRKQDVWAHVFDLE